MDLDTKHENYKNWSIAHRDVYGFYSYGCDSLGFSALTNCAFPEQVFSPESAIDIFGRIRRKPVHKACYPDHSDSTISRDHLLMLAFWIHTHSHHKLAEYVVKYAFWNWFIMGEGKDWKTTLGRCFMTPSLLATYLMILGYRSTDWIPCTTGHLQTGYQAHIQVLHCVLRRLIRGKYTRNEEDVINGQYNRQPHNPLFAVATGEKPIFLANDHYYPDDQLPSTQTHQEPWLPQRDMGDDWKPSTTLYKEHPGGDFIFCYWLYKQLN